jgi:Flp pilus assembly protein TadG
MKKHEAGQALAEFALILPVLMLIVMGLFDFGRAIYAYNAISNAAREGARLAIVNQSTNSGRPAAADEAANQATALGLNPATDVTVAYRTADLSGSCQAVGCIAEVTVRYRFTAITPIIGSFVGPINMSSTTQLPIEAACTSACP